MQASVLVLVMRGPAQAHEMDMNVGGLGLDDNFLELLVLRIKSRLK